MSLGPPIPWAYRTRAAWRGGAPFTGRCPCASWGRGGPQWGSQQPARLKAILALAVVPLVRPLLPGDPQASTSGYFLGAGGVRASQREVSRLQVAFLPGDTGVRWGGRMERRPLGAGCPGRRGGPCVAQLSWGIWLQGRGPGRPCGRSAAPHWARLWVLLLAGVPSPQSHRPPSPQAGQWVWRLLGPVPSAGQLLPLVPFLSVGPTGRLVCPCLAGTWAAERLLETEAGSWGSSTGGRSRCL